MWPRDVTNMAQSAENVVAIYNKRKCICILVGSPSV
jgi:hypothetical protein